MKWLACLALVLLLAGCEREDREFRPDPIGTETHEEIALTPLSLLAVLAFAFAAGRSIRAPESTPATIADMLRELPPPVKSPVASTNTPAPIKLTVPPPPPVVPVNLTDAAELCVDLARVMDARDMQVLLERTAKVL